MALGPTSPLRPALSLAPRVPPDDLRETVGPGSRRKKSEILSGRADEINEGRVVHCVVARAPGPRLREEDLVGERRVSGAARLGALLPTPNSPSKPIYAIVVARFGDNRCLSRITPRLLRCARSAMS